MVFIAPFPPHFTNTSIHSQNGNVCYTCLCGGFSCFKEAEPHNSIIALGEGLQGVGSQCSLVGAGAGGATPPSTEKLLRLCTCDGHKARCLNEEKHLLVN